MLMSTMKPEGSGTLTAEEVVRGELDAWSRLDVDEIVSFFAPDAVWDNVPIGPELRAQGVDNNQQLSLKRAQTVGNFLISQGVNPNLVSERGLGDADPVAPNDTPQGRAQNRRVELTLAGPGT